MFLEFWKRRQAEIAYEWDLLGYEDEEVGFYCTLYHTVPRSTTQYPWRGYNTRVFVVHGGASYRYLVTSQTCEKVSVISFENAVKMKI